MSLSYVLYGLVIALPSVFLGYYLYPRPSTLSIPAADPNKPAKSIMQPPREDLIPPKDDPFTIEQLKAFDGSDSSKPIYVAIKGDIFDVTHKADSYGKGKSYNIFAGKDGSRGLGKSSLKLEDAVADYSVLDEAERKVLDDWHSFFCKRYNIVGRVVSEPKI
ncbi:cytochrome b5 [Macrolepiota fuliginosa MF-IS2]|uniref:Cytochrome b5 n=1 Tax=Macrolepiota fuliginosa MF-IS2 TaxID=1400762 RepID=A0A9P6C023_9AGAR|nr:cytochrome b5 [Macrolepiota fuliginosa MF-IS2]